MLDDRDVRAGSVGKAMITLGVTDLDQILARLATHGIGHEPVETYSNRVRHVVVLDPDGNSRPGVERPARCIAAIYVAGVSMIRCVHSR